MTGWTIHENASKWVWNFEIFLTLGVLPVWDKNGLKKYFPIVEMGLFFGGSVSYWRPPYQISAWWQFCPGCGEISTNSTWVISLYYTAHGAIVIHFFLVFLLFSLCYPKTAHDRITCSQNCLYRSVQWKYLLVCIFFYSLPFSSNFYISTRSFKFFFHLTCLSLQEMSNKRTTH